MSPAWIVAREPAVLGSRLDGLAIDLEQDDAALDAGVERRAQRLHFRHEDAVNRLRDLEPFGAPPIDVADDEPERSVLVGLDPVRRRRRAVASRFTLVGRPLGQGHHDGLFFAVPDQPDVNRGAGRAAGDFVDELIVVRHRPVVERDDRVVRPEPGAVPRRIVAHVLNQGAARRPAA